MTTPLLVASSNAAVGFPAAMEGLRDGGRALDAVEVAVRAVEDNPEDHTVGYSGLPNLIGQIELDALIMDGRTLAAGAVAALRGFRHPVSVARHVMEELPHVMLASEGAAHFAREMGFQAEDLLTDEALRIWRERLEAEGHSPEVHRYYAQMKGWAHRFATDPEQAEREWGTSVTGTVVVLACDVHGDLAVAASTSGWAWKYPGRVGDTPVVGAGGYADNRYGAAACTGRGEMAVRAVTARSLVLYMKMGLTLWDAAREAVLDLYALDDPYASTLNVVAIDAHGGHVGFSNRPERRYIFQTAEMDIPAERPCVYVEPDGKAEMQPL
jgi:beta-aspartyl-peptidase (threonine type)